MENVILVNERDEQIGVEEKLKAHQEGKLHRAFSIFIFNDRKELLLQQRALDKYHSGGLWTNTCCGHPRPEEDTVKAGQRRLNEEMGIVCELKEIFSFVYKVEFQNGLTENEFDHVLFGTYNDDPLPNLEEVESYRWITLADLKSDIKNHPEIYSEWLKICIDKVLEYKINS